MSWEPSLRRVDDSPLGSRGDVFGAISQAFPETEFKLAPSGQEMLAEMERLDPKMPESSRNAILRMPAQWQGVCDTEQVSVQFTFPEDEQVAWISIRSTGDHSESQKRLRQLATEKGWLLDGDFSQ